MSRVHAKSSAFPSTSLRSLISIRCQSVGLPRRSLLNYRRAERRRRQKRGSRRESSAHEMGSGLEPRDYTGETWRARSCSTTLLGRNPCGYQAGQCHNTWAHLLKFESIFIAEQHGLFFGQAMALQQTRHELQMREENTHVCPVHGSKEGDNRRRNKC